MTEQTTNDETELTNGEAAAPADAPEQDSANPLAALQAEIEDLKSKTLYAQAETQNVRRRLEKEKQDAATYAATGFARDVLSVADNLSRALAAIPADLRADERLKSLLTGIEMTGKELETVFQRNGITKIEALGQPLDPNRHQAMIELERADAPAGTIVEEMQAGYMIKDRLLRPALVGVAKAPAAGRVDLEA